MEERIVKDINDLLAQLFQKMKEAGYEWDSEKKELKKIEQKQVIDYPDNFPKDNWELIHEFVNKFGRIPKDEDELNVLMEYVLKRQRSTWGEDDERLIEEASEYLRKYADHHVQGGISKVYVHSIADGLESLRPQNTWKPSDEQMEILKELVEDSNQRYFYTILKSLYEQLKNLRDG